MRVTGFTFEAALYCYDCTQLRFGPPRKPVSPWLDVTDSESNPVHPVFENTEFEYRPACNSCGEPIIANFDRQPAPAPG